MVNRTVKILYPFGRYRHIHFAGHAFPYAFIQNVERHLNDRGITLRPIAARPIVRGAVHSECLAGLGDGQPADGDHIDHGLAAFSSTLSASSRLTVLFSCSSSLSRVTSEASSPPYVACHLSQLAELMPYFRQNSIKYYRISPQRPRACC